MNKKIFIALLAIFVVSAVILLAPGMTKAGDDLEPGTVIKGKGLSTLYYLGEDGKRYVFPNANIFFSWFDNFDDVVEVELEDLYQYPLGGNAHYKPGKLLVKIQTDPKVYAVSLNGKLRWIKTEKLAKHFYGNNWPKMVDDVPDSFFTDYNVDEDIDEEGDYDPDEEEEEVPTISHNRGWRAKVKIMNRLQTRQEKRCRYITRALNRLQKRAARWGIEIPDLGDDYISECAESSQSDPGDDNESSGKKTTICHTPPGNPDNAHTISVGRAALKAHIRHGDSVGACEGDTDEEPDEDEDDPDETAPVITDVASEAGHNSATITWTTDEAADSMVEYADENIATASTTEETGDSTSTTSHSVELTGLEPETTYYYIVKSEDSEGNLATSAEYTFTTTAAPDETAPVITDITATASGTDATITWTTDEEADSKVIYSVEEIASSTSLEEVSDSAMVTSHTLELTGLATSTTYYFEVESSDAAANKATSPENTFTTD